MNSERKQYDQISDGRNYTTSANSPSISNNVAFANESNKSEYGAVVHHNNGDDNDDPPVETPEIFYKKNMAYIRYYKRAFPYESIRKFFTMNQHFEFNKRMFVFNYNTDTFIYNLSFEDAKSFQIETLARVPLQIAAAGQLNYPPSVFRTHVVDDREVIFDLDLTDYSDVRTCCTNEKKCCRLCWKYASATMEMINNFLGKKYKHILFTFSGRRGIHCYIFDKQARLARKNILDEISLTTRVDGIYTINDDVNINCDFILSNTAVMAKYFDEICIQDQNLFSCDLGMDALVRVASFSGVEYGNTIEQLLAPYRGKNPSSRKIMDLFKKTLMAKSKRLYQFSKIILLVEIFCPRFDTQVTIDPNHLLKIPFSIHSSTHNIILPLIKNKPFNPETDAINLVKLLHELSEEKNSLQPYIQYFNNFISELQ